MTMPSKIVKGGAPKRKRHSKKKARTAGMYSYDDPNGASIVDFSQSLLRLHLQTLQTIQTATYHNLKR